jgi:methyltransferase-like protein
MTWARRLAPAHESVLNELASDQVERDQLLDFVFETPSRRSLLCHRDVVLNRRWPPQSLDGFCLAARLRPEPSEVAGSPETTFHCFDGRTISTTEAGIRAALTTLAATWPESMSFGALEAQVQRSIEERAGSWATTAELTNSWMGDILHCFIADIVELNVCTPACTGQITDRPRTTKLARQQALNSDWVTNLRHQVIYLDEFDRRVLAKLDGNRSLTELATVLAGQSMSGVPSPKRNEQGHIDWDAALSESLQRLALRALLLRHESTPHT